MTIPSPSWCPTCEDTCTAHSSICTTCGSTLEQPPTENINSSNSSSNEQQQPRQPSVGGEPSFSMLGGFPWQQELQAAQLQGQQLASVLEAFRLRSQNIRNETRVLQEAVQRSPSTQQQQEFERQLRETERRVAENEQLITQLDRRLRDFSLRTAAVRQEMNWEAMLPPEAMDPQQAASRARPTAKSVLDSLERIALTEQSSLLYHAVLQVHGANNDSGKIEFQAFPGEFGPTPPHRLQKAVLVVAEPPRTGKGNKLNDRTIQNIQDCLDARYRVIVYMERGDDVTFVQKALMAQNAGACGVVIANNKATPWPYSMKDSKGEAASLGLLIPVVMVSQSDGRTLVEVCSAKSAATTPMLCSLNIESETDECIVCRDDFGVGQTVLCLPACGHVFHETCALAWLSKNNSCPFCRRELPTDNLEYEEERRRTQRTHAGSSSAANSGSAYQADDFYG